MLGPGFDGTGSGLVASSSNKELPEAPDPAAAGGNTEQFDSTPGGVKRQAPFSRMGIGADVSPLGIGIKSAIVLNEYFDARLMGNFFNYNSAQFEIEGFSANANLHWASAAAALDWYPFNSVWRLSPGLIFYNGNQMSVAANIVPGTSFTLNGQTFYSATANPVTGATPLIGTGVLGLNTVKPAATATFGFGKFIPRSNRHWSFPSEFGVAYTGAPSANVNVSGWACTDFAQKQCSNLSNLANPVAIEFNNALQTELTKWRKDLAKVRVYPLFSYSVVYSFNIR
ncbi:MAG: hypothetical protein ACLPSO_08900 [Terracidiphilus sp.]